MRFSYNIYAFQWSFPEIVADQVGLFRQEGLNLKFSSFIAKKDVRKNVTYNSLMRSGGSDIYHAGEWACIIRVSQNPDTRIVAASRPGNGTLNSTFSIYVRPDSKLERPEMLANKRIAVEEDTGSYFTVVQDMKRFVQKDQIKLVQVGSPHMRLVSLLNGEVEAASLIHPWTELANEMGLVELVRTDRRNPTLAVANLRVNITELRSFFRAVNHAIELLNDPNEDITESYANLFLRICEELPQTCKDAAQKVARKLKPPKWQPWQPYTSDEFRRAITLLEDLSVAPNEVTFKYLVHPQIDEIFKL